MNKAGPSKTKGHIQTNLPLAAVHNSHKIHSTAIIDEQVILGEGVEVGPYSIIQGNVQIGDQTKIHSHVHIYSETTIGKNCEIYPFAAIGGTPQDLKYRGEKSSVFIGDGTVIREHATIHKGTEGGRMETYIGKNCLIMGVSHIAHDCYISDEIIIAHNAVIGGHVWIGRNAIVGGLAAIHQYVRIGQHAIIGAGSVVTRDVIPYGNAYGPRSSLHGINIIGMRRHNLPAQSIEKAMKLYQFLFKRDGDKSEYFQQRLADACATDFGPLGKEITDFIQEDNRRSLCVEAEDNSSGSNSGGTPTPASS